MIYKPDLNDHERMAEEINELCDRLVSLSVDVSNTIGKTKARKMTDKIDKIKDELSSVRFQLEDIMLNEYPNAPLYTSYRKYRTDA